MHRRSNPRAACLLSCLLMLALVGCGRDSTQPAATTTSGARPTSSTRSAPTAAPAALQDVVERDPRFMIGISYPPVASTMPGLAAELKLYADAARAELMQAVAGMGNAKPAAPYDLS